MFGLTLEQIFVTNDGEPPAPRVRGVEPVVGVICVICVLGVPGNSTFPLY